MVIAVSALFIGVSTPQAQVVKIGAASAEVPVAGAMTQGISSALQAPGLSAVEGPLSTLLPAAIVPELSPAAAVIVSPVVEPQALELSKAHAARQDLERAASQISQQSRSGSGSQIAQTLNELYGNGKTVPVVSVSVSGAGAEQAPKAFIKNAEGVWVGGRVAEQYLEVDRLEKKLSPKMDLSQAMNVMDESFDEARVKLAGVEKAAANRRISASGVHLEETLTWIDAVLDSQDGRKIAEHTHRVFFHPANNPQSEISEGNRRVDAYIEKAKADFAPGGRAERDLKTKLDEVILTFDTRGYVEIADHLRQKEAELRKQFPDRYTFQYVTEPALSAAQLRSEYNRLVGQYKSQPKGLMNIIDGVTYSRYVGLLLELKAHEYSDMLGETVLQAGRDFFEEIPQPDGSVHRRYITEFDGVVRTQNGDIILEEAKSARVPLPLEEVMKDKFLYKLEIYKSNQALIEKSLGAPLKVRFLVDVGGRDRRAAQQGKLVWSDPRQMALKDYLEKQGPALSAKYGFPVTFVFLNSHPHEDLLLFYRKPMSQDDWDAQQGGRGQGPKKHKGSGRRR